MFCDARMYSEGLGSIMLLLLADCVSSNFFLLLSTWNEANFAPFGISKGISGYPASIREHNPVPIHVYNDWHFVCKVESSMYIQYLTNIYNMV